MAKTLEQFIKDYDGKFVDFDGYAGPQCMDLYRQYVKEVLNLPQSPALGQNGKASDVWITYLKEHFTRIDNTINAIPEPGDIIIWNDKVGGGFGHIAVCVEAGQNSLKSFDQNWPKYSKCHIQGHYYSNILGWIRAKGDIIDDMPDYIRPLLKESLKLDIDAPEGDVRGRVDEIKRSTEKYAEQEKRIKDLEKQVGGYAAEAAEYEERLRLTEQSRERIEKEVEGLRADISRRDGEIDDLQKEIAILKESVNPETKIVIDKDEYERLIKRRKMDRLTTREIFKELFIRALDRTKSILRYFTTPKEG